MPAKSTESPAVLREVPEDYLIPLREVKAQTGMGRAYIYARITEGTFPAPAKIGTASRWSVREVQQWIAGRLQARVAKGTTP